MNWQSLNRTCKASLILVSLLLLWGCAKQNAYIKLQGGIFGTSFHITYKDPSTGLSEAIVLAEVESRLESIDWVFSTYKPASEVSRFNRLESVEATQGSLQLSPTNSITVSDDFIQVLQLSRIIYQQSDRAFNPALGALVELWGFGARLSIDNFNRIPDAKDIHQALAATDLLAVKNQQNVLYKTAPVQLDFSAIAKGYAVDQIAQILREFNIEHFMVEIGGELVTSGLNSNGDAWKIGIETPDMLSDSVADVLNLTASALATSGDYRNYFEIDGKHYSHTIDPRTGYPVQHNLASVTVLADSSAAADAWATAFMVLGTEKSLVLADKHQLSSLLISRESKAYTAHTAANFEKYTP